MAERVLHGGEGVAWQRGCGIEGVAWRRGCYMEERVWHD